MQNSLHPIPNQPTTNPVRKLSTQVTEGIKNKMNFATTAKAINSKMHVIKVLEDPDTRFANLMLKTNLHGLPDLYDSIVGKKFGNIMLYMSVIITALAILSWQVYMTWIDFRDKPILTTYRLMNHEKGVPFPNTYVCLNNPIHHQELLNANVNKEWLAENLKDILSESSISGLSGVLSAKTGLASALLGVVIPKPPHPTVLPPPLKHCEIENPNGGKPIMIPDCNFTSTTTTTTTTTTTQIPWIPKDSEEFLMRVGYPINVLFEECAWQSAVLDCAEYVKPVYDTNYGKCFEIAFLETNQTVADNGLSFVLNLDPINALSFDRSSRSHYPVSIFDGAVIQVAPQGGSIIMSETKTRVGSGTHTRLTLEATHMKLVDAESLSTYCVDGEDAALLMKIYKMPYSASLCKQECVAKQLLTDCACILPMHRRQLSEEYKDVKFCTVLETKTCVAEASKSTEFKTAVLDCSSQCFISCSVWQLRLDTSSTQFPSPMFEDAVTETYESLYERITVKPNICEEKPECAEDQTQSGWKPFYWDMATSKCLQMDCWPIDDANVFESAKKCKETCDPCAQQITSDTSCIGEQTMIWAYNYTCELIWHGYCDVTNNKYLDEQSCLDTCWDTRDFRRANKYDTTDIEDLLERPRISGYLDQRTISAAEANEEAILRERHRFLRTQYGWRNRIVVDVAFNHLQYVSIEQSPSMTFTTFVGNIGGHCGLWLGASIISLSKIIIIIAPLFGSAIRACYRRRFKKK